MVNSVSILEDIKFLLGFFGIGNMNYLFISFGFLVKYICVICGDRFLGMCRSSRFFLVFYVTRFLEKVFVLLFFWLFCI